MNGCGWVKPEWEWGKVLMSHSLLHLEFVLMFQTFKCILQFFMGRYKKVKDGQKGVGGEEKGSKAGCAREQESLVHYESTWSKAVRDCKRHRKVRFCF